MKLLDGFISIIFSLVILIVSIAIALVLMDFASKEFIFEMLNDYIFNIQFHDIVLTTSIVCALAALKTTVFRSSFKSKDNTPIIVASEHGDVEIAQETITNTVKSVAMKLNNIKDINAKMIKKRNGIKIYANISVLANSNIKALTEELQSKVIEVIKETTGVKVLNVNVKVKNIYEKGQKFDNKKVEAAKVEKPIVEVQKVEELVEEPVKEEVVEVEKNIENDEKGEE